MAEYLQGGKVIDCSGIKMLVDTGERTFYVDYCSRKHCPCREFELRLMKT